ncbi:Protein ariadne-1, partial [Orchesella cincta]
WLKKCDDDSETSNWIAANTKECPKCNATIEKDGGCNHMVCKNQNCKADFCWVCLGPWEPHGSSWYNCNRYDESEAKAARDAQEKSRLLCNAICFTSLKFENKLYASVKEKMEEMQQHNMSWIEVQFLKKAVDILCQCRQTLMFTYVFAFYLQKTNQSVIFEDNQRDLESATEKLSEYLERDITSENLADIKQKVQDKYRYCDSRRQVLLDHVYEGYEKDWWDGGCNHMVCKNQNCKADFCWVCLDRGNLTALHGIIATDMTSQKPKLPETRRKNQGLLCNAICFTLRKKMEEMQQHNMSWIEVQFLKKKYNNSNNKSTMSSVNSNYVIFIGTWINRMLLTFCVNVDRPSCSPMFLPFTCKRPTNLLFLKTTNATWSLQQKSYQSIWREILHQKLADIKQKVQDKYRYCDSRRQVLLDHVYEGYEKDWWVYNDQ